MAWGSLFFKFDGRINRAKYCLAVVICFAICGTLFILNNLSQSATVQATSGMIYIVVLISFLAVGIKRLHDRSRSGWYLILFYIIPSILFFVGVLISFYSEEAVLVGVLLWLLAAAVGLWAFIELCCLRGVDGANQYGPDPLALAAVSPTRQPV